MRTIHKYPIIEAMPGVGMLLIENGANILTNQSTYENGTINLFAVVDTNEPKINVPIILIPTDEKIDDLPDSYTYLTTSHQPKGEVHVFIQIPSISFGYQPVNLSEC